MLTSAQILAAPCGQVNLLAATQVGKAGLKKFRTIIRDLSALCDGVDPMPLFVTDSTFEFTSHGAKAQLERVDI